MRLSSPLPETRGPPRPRGSPFRGFRGHFRSLSLFRRGPRRVGLVFVTIMLITRNGKRLRPLGGSSAEPRSSTLGRTSCRTFETEPAGSTGRSPLTAHPSPLPFGFVRAAGVTRGPAPERGSMANALCTGRRTLIRTTAGYALGSSIGLRCSRCGCRACCCCAWQPACSRRRC